MTSAAALAPGLFDSRTDTTRPAIVTVYALDRVGAGYRTRIYRAADDAAVTRVLAEVARTRPMGRTRVSIIGRRAV